MFNVFDSASQENGEDYILVYSQDDIYTLCLALSKAYHAKIKSSKMTGENPTIVSFEPREAALSNNNSVTLKPIEISSIYPILMDILLQYPKLKEKAGRQDEIIIDYKQRLGITDPSSPA